MATSAFTIANKTVVNSGLQHEVGLRCFFTQFTGKASKLNGTTGGQEEWKMSGSPINEFRDFKYTGRNKMIIPVLGRLKGGYGRNGKERVAGHEAEPNWFWQSLFIHLKRHGVAFPDIVDQEAINWATKMSDYKETLADWWANYRDHDVVRAYLEGYSKHITDSTADGGLGQTVRYNPNFWVYDGAANDFSTLSPSFSYTSSTYKASIISALGNLASTDTFCTDTLENIAAKLPHSRIKGWMQNGEEVYPLIIHSLQAKSLRQDSEWLAAQGRTGMGNMFKNEIGRWGPLVVIKNDKVARLAYAASTTLNFFDYDEGADNSANLQYALAQAPGDYQHYACALLLGADSMNLGIYQDLVYKPKETEDYEMISGAAGMMYYGLARNDSYNEDLGDTTAPTDQLPCQSAVIVTYES